MPSVITANRLTDGVVVYLAPGGAWTEDIEEASRAEGLGLSIMRERAGRIQGTLKVGTSPGEGTTISLKAPLSS